MKNIFSPGDTKVYNVIVEEKDIATFDSGTVHPVYATFALARDVEWTCRLFVLEMKEDDEEGIGTMLSIEHLSPALPGSRIQITATVETIENNRFICSYVVYANERLIARGKQGQKVLKKKLISEIFSKAKERG